MSEQLLNPHCCFFGVLVLPNPHHGPPLSLERRVRLAGNCA